MTECSLDVAISQWCPTWAMPFRHRCSRGRRHLPPYGIAGPAVRQTRAYPNSSVCSRRHNVHQRSCGRSPSRLGPDHSWGPLRQRPCRTPKTLGTTSRCREIRLHTSLMDFATDGRLGRGTRQLAGAPTTGLTDSKCTIGDNGWSCQGVFDEKLVRLLRMSRLERQQAYFQ